MTAATIIYNKKPEFKRLKTFNELKDFLKKKNNVLLAFLFGSFATGKITHESDIDIAVLFEKKPGIYETEALKDGIESILKKEVDIAVLNEATPILRMQVLKNGIVIYKRDEKHFNKFYTDTINQYYDLKQTRKKCEDNILRGRIYA